MNALTIAATMFASAFVSSLVGMVLHVRLPEYHLDADSRDVLKLVMSLIATMAALVLSLLVASANNTYNGQSSELQSMAANVVLLDRMLALYGPDAAEARIRLRDATVDTHDRIWPSDRMGAANLDPAATQRSTDNFVVELEALPAKTDAQKAIQGLAFQLAENVAQTRMLMFAQFGDSIAWPFLTVLVFWLCVLFLGFGLFARCHATTTMALLIGALSVAGAIFLILEMSQPYGGVMRISDAPLRGALGAIGR